MAPQIQDIEQVSRVIAQVAAPAFLLSAVASLLSVLVTRVNRVIDRYRLINAPTVDGAERSRHKTEMPILRQRAEFMHRAIFCCTGAGIATCGLVIVSFASALLEIQHERGAAVLFIVAMGLFTAALFYLAREVRLSAAAIHGLDWGRDAAETNNGPGHRAPHLVSDRDLHAAQVNREHQADLLAADAQNHAL